MVRNTVGKPESSVPHDIAANRFICLSGADEDREELQQLPAWSDGGLMPDLQMAVPAVCLSGPNLVLKRLSLW